MTDNPSMKNVVIKSPEKNYDALDAEKTIKAFCAFIREVISRFEENKRQQEIAEAEQLWARFQSLRQRIHDYINDEVSSGTFHKSYEGRIIALDACTGHSGKVNVIVLEDED